MSAPVITRPWFQTAAVVTALLLLFVLQYRLWFDDTGMLASRDLQQKTEQLRQDNEVRQNQNRALFAEVKDLKSGSEILEEKAREDLGLVRSGETFILFVDPEQP